MYIFAYAQPDSDAANFLCETSGARSHLWRCWSPGMAVWAQTDFFSKCSPRISRVWAQLTALEDLFPMVFCVLDRYWVQMTVCINLFSMLFHQKGEHFLEKSRLYLSSDSTWGTILKKPPAVPKNRRNFKNTWGTNHKKASAVPNPHCQRSQHHHKGGV